MVSQILAVIIFVVMFVEIVREKFPRYLVTLVAGVLTLVVVFLLAMQSLPDVWKALSLESMAETTFWYTGHMTVNEMNTGINWSTILFISGMMIMVEGMSEAGFFDWLCLRLAKLVNYKPVPLMICFMILSAVLSMFIDSITVILFLAVASVHSSDYRGDFHRQPGRCGHHERGPAQHHHWHGPGADLWGFSPEHRAHCPAVHGGDGALFLFLLPQADSEPG